MYTDQQTQGLKKFLQNKYWKDIFDKSPSENVKMYYAEHFAYGLGLSSGDAHTEKVIAIFKTLSEGDWAYIIANCHNNMGKWGLVKCKEKYGK